MLLFLHTSYNSTFGYCNNRMLRNALDEEIAAFQMKATGMVLLYSELCMCAFLDEPKNNTCFRFLINFENQNTNKQVQTSQIFLLSVLRERAVHITYHAVILEVNGTSFLEKSVKLQSIENLSKQHVIPPNNIQLAEEHFAEFNGIGNITARKLQEKLSVSWGQLGSAGVGERGHN